MIPRSSISATLFSTGTVRASICRPVPHLASTDLCPHQAFSLGRSLLGLQFHPEVTATGLEQWYVGHTGELRAHGLSPANLRQDAARFAPMLAHQSTAFLQAWLTDL